MVEVASSGGIFHRPTVRGHYAQGSFRHSRRRAGRTGDWFIYAASAAA
jgi:hypothetical protein